jgi:hypothetical protein
MTIATLLGYMLIFDNELETGSGEPDESRAITALNMAQDEFESVAAALPKFLQTYSTLTTTASQEYTTWPTDLLRLDDLWFIDPLTSRPAYRLDSIDDTGGHAPSQSWPTQLASGTTGKPCAYAATPRSRLLWQPLPDAVHTLRYYGFIRASDIASRAGTFAYDDSVAMPLAAFATKILAVGVGDSTDELTSMAQAAFGPVLKAIKKSVSVRPLGRYYSQVHTT